MELFHRTNIDFMGIRRWTYVFSSALILAGIVSLIARGGLHYGVDFSGGTLVQVSFRDAVAVNEVRSALDPVGLGQAEIQLSRDVAQAGRPDIIIRAPGTKEGEDAGAAISSALRARFGDAFEVRRTDRVGPKIGKELRKNASWAVLIGLILLLIYMSWRFEFRSGVSAVVAMAHDVLIMVGLISITNREVSLSLLAAILTVIGYSTNDTIVVFDRQRENRRLFHREPFVPLVNNSINQTLSRTVITAGVTMLAVVSLFFLGGEVLHDFAFVLMVGIFFGTYSSVFVASAVLVDWEIRKPRAGISVSAAKPKGHPTRPAGRSRETTGARA